mgnify:FL=1
MDFKIPQETEMIVKSVAEFCQRELAPTIAERDEKEIFDD